MTPHNPEKLKDETVGVSSGWRLLMKEELKNPPADHQYYAVDAFNRSWQRTGHNDLSQLTSLTFRTKEPLPQADALDQLVAFLS